MALFVLKIHPVAYPELIGQNQVTKPILAARELGREPFYLVHCCCKLQLCSLEKEDVDSGPLAVTATVLKQLPCICPPDGQSLIRQVSSWQR